MGDLVNVQKAAKAVGLSRTKLYKAVAAGIVPCYRCGRALRFDIDELREWMRRAARGLGANHG